MPNSDAQYYERTKCSGLVKHLPVSNLEPLPLKAMRVLNMILTCPAQQCTDEAPSRRCRCACPPTSLLKPAGTEAEMPPS